MPGQKAAPPICRRGAMQNPPQLNSTDLEVFEVDTLMWSSSSDSSSQADGLEDRAADVEDYIQNRRNTGSVHPNQMLGASADSEADLWKCRACGWAYPNNHPSARQKLLHKKHCKGLINDAMLLSADAAASADDNSEKQGSADVDEQVVTQYEVNAAAVVPNSEVEATFALEDTSMNKGLDNLLSANGRASGSDEGSIEDLGFKCRNGLLDHHIEAIHKHDDEQKLGFSSSSSSLVSSSRDAVPTDWSVEQAISGNQELLLDVSSSWKENHDEKVSGSNGQEPSPRQAGTEHGPPMASDEELGLSSPSSSSFLSSPSSASSSSAVIPNELLVVETTQENHDALLDVSSSFKGCHAENKSDSIAPEPSSCQAEAEIVRNSIDGQVQGADTNQDPGLAHGSPHLEAFSPLNTPLDQGLTEVKTALEVSESSNKDAGSAGGHEEVAHDPETGPSSVSEGTMREKPSRHHPHEGHDGFREYIVESPRETSGWTEATSSRYLEAYEVERVIRTQTTHDLICPYCRHNVTDRIILRKRKRTSRVSHETWVQEYDSSSAHEEESLRPDSPETAELGKDKASFWGCLSCFTIFIPKWGEPQPAEALSDHESKSSTACLPLFFPPFKWKSAEATAPLPAVEAEPVEKAAGAAPKPPPDDVSADPQNVKKASWLSCLPDTLTSFQVPAAVAYNQTEKEGPSSPDTMELPESVGSLLVEAHQTSATKDLEEEILNLNLKEPPPAPGPAAEDQELGPVDMPETVDIVEENFPTELQKASTSEIVEVPDEMPASTTPAVYLAEEVEKTSCLSFLPATLTSFDPPRRVEPQYKYTFKQIQGEDRAKVSVEGYGQKDEASCLSCLPATLTSWDFPSTPLLEPQTEEDVASTEEVQKDATLLLKAEEGSQEGKTSCMSWLPVTLTSWEFPQPLPQTSSEDDVASTEEVGTSWSKPEEGSHEEKTSCLSYLPVTLTSWEFPQNLPQKSSASTEDAEKDRTIWLKAEEGSHEEKTLCLSCLPVTLTNLDFPQSLPQTPVEDRKIFSEEKTSCLSFLPATFTSWEFPQSLPQTPSDGHEERSVLLKPEEDGEDERTTEENVEAIPAEEPRLSQDKETSSCCCLPLTLRGFNVAQPKLKLPETETRVSIPELDRGTKVLHEIVIQGNITNSTTTEEPGEPSTTDTSVTYFRTSVKVAEARRRFRRKGGQYAAPGFSLEGQEEEEEEEEEEGVEWEDGDSTKPQELSFATEKDVQEMTSQDAVTVTEGAPPPMSTHLSVAPQKLQSELSEPSTSRGKLLWKHLQSKSFQKQDVTAQSVSFWSPESMSQLAISWPSDWSKSSVGQSPQSDWTKFSVAAVEGSLPAAEVVEKIESTPQESREVISEQQPPTITTVSIAQTYTTVEVPVHDKDFEDWQCNCLPAPKFSWFTQSSDYTKLDSSKPAPAVRPAPYKIDGGSDWAELQVPLLASKPPPDAEPEMTTVGIRSDDVSIQVQGPDAATTLEAAVTEAQNAGILEQTNDGSEGIEIVKSIVYGGLDSTLTSLAVVASAAGGEGKTITVVALGIANVLAGMLAFFFKVMALDSETFRTTIGRNLWLNGSVAILSFIIFGMAAPITFGFTFQDLDDRDYKVYATCSVAIVCLVLLGSAKAYVNRLNTWTTVLGLLATGFLSAVMGYFAGDYVTKLLKKYGFVSEDSD